MSLKQAFKIGKGTKQNGEIRKSSIVETILILLTLIMSFLYANITTFLLCVFLNLAFVEIIKVIEIMREKELEKENNEQ